MFWKTSLICIRLSPRPYKAQRLYPVQNNLLPEVRNSPSSGFRTAPKLISSRVASSWWQYPVQNTQKRLKVFQKGGSLNCRTIANILNICSTGGIPAITASSTCQPLRQMSLKQQQSFYLQESISQSLRTLSKRVISRGCFKNMQINITSQSTSPFL